MERKSEVKTMYSETNTASRNTIKIFLKLISKILESKNLGFMVNSWLNKNTAQKKQVSNICKYAN